MPRAIFGSLPYARVALVVACLGACGCRARDQAGGSADAKDVVTDGGATVETAIGPVFGTSNAGVRSYRGIPYAEPPTGALRFAPTRPAVAWDEPRDATEFGQPCVQPLGTGVTGSEDCLTLNVWTPEGADPASLPVMVFLHGGDNYWGSSTGRTPDGLYDGTQLAAQGAVVVTLNYRLGALGFLSHPSLASGGGSGNWALHDQREALRWVRASIARFGGDPERVLLFGQSAGSYDACALVSSPAAAGLFHAAILQSGPCWIPPAEDIAEGIAATLTHLGCDDVADPASCLRDRPAELFALAPRSSNDLRGLHKYFYPVVDGVILDEPPLEAIRAGRHNQVPLVFGSNEDEMTTLLPGVHVTDSTTYHAFVVGTVGQDRAFSVETEYLADAILSYDRAIFRMMGDLFFHCRIRRAARAAVAAQDEPVWRYVYAHALERGSIGSFDISSFAAGHGLELLPLFQDHPDWWEPTADELALSSRMGAAWRAMADHGTFDLGEGVAPAYDAATDPYVVLDAPISADAGWRASHCDFWDARDPA